VNLDLNFEELILNKLSRGSKEAFLQQLDPATMEEINRKRIHTEILKTVYGKCNDAVFSRNNFIMYL
jgi:hypothetical protein